MAVFAGYFDLRIAVADHVGNSNISDVMSRLTQTAEAWLNQKLRAREQITMDTVTFASGSAPLPADYLEMVALYDVSGRYPLTQGTLQETKRVNSPYWRYAVDGSNIYLYGVTGDRNIEYYAALPTISSSAAGSNWLLQKYPNAYLYAVSLEAAKFLRDAELTQATATLLQGAMNDLKIDDERAQWGNGAVRLQMQTP
jgi:hypothetical protein